MYYPCSPAVAFERRVRFAIRRLQKVYPTLNREMAMDMVRHIPPQHLSMAMHRLSIELARRHYAEKRRRSVTV